MNSSRPSVPGTRRPGPLPGPPEGERSRPPNQLRAAVHKARKDPNLNGHPALDVPADAVDPVRFEALARAGHERLGRDPERARELLGEALAL